MMKKVVSVLLGAMLTIGLCTGNAEAKEVNKTQNNVLKAGKIVAIEYSKNPKSKNWKKSLDKLYFEVDGQIYLYYDYAEDMFVDDDVLVIMNTKGTKSLKDDVIRDYMYWRPDLESKSGYMDVVKNGSCINK